MRLVSFHEELENSRRRLLDSIEGSADVTFIRLYGNLGDQLIYAGARQLLANIPYREISIRNLSAHQGHTAILAGCGGWCHAFHSLPAYFYEIQRRFERVIVFPSSFDISVPSVREAITDSQAIFFSRERYSYSQIEKLCDARLAFDTAFFFNFAPYRAAGNGTLTAFRTDQETRSRIAPLTNDDISLSCETLDEWLWKIARSECVRTDRAHVMIAAAMLGKKVRFRPSNYHKVPGIAEYALCEFDVQPLKDNEGELNIEPPIEMGKSGSISDGRQGDEWSEKIVQASREIACVVPSGSTFMLVDDDQLGRLPIGERRPIPFIERAGSYWGPPPDSETAIREFERLCEVEPACIVFAWPAFWWFSCYPEFLAYLRERFPCVVENDRLHGFALDGQAHRVRCGENAMLNNDLMAET
jgi:hypothetical protein